MGIFPPIEACNPRERLSLILDILQHVTIRCIIKQQTKTTSKTGINNLRLTDACLLTLRQVDYSCSPREIEKSLFKKHTLGRILKCELYIPFRRYFARRYVVFLAVYSIINS